MSDDLRNIYKKENKLAYYFDEKVPCDLYRGQRDVDAKKGLPRIYPNPGFNRGNGQIRPADVKIVERDGNKFVLGCRATSGFFRGVSTFDRKNPDLSGFRWFCLPMGVEIPEALAITQESAHKDRANHYTIAPKDDMPLELFLAWLKVLDNKLLES